MYRFSVGQQDVRPGLQFSRKAERQHQLERRRQEADQRRREQNRPRHVLETEHREKALDQVRRSGLLFPTFGPGPGGTVILTRQKSKHCNFLTLIDAVCK